jgi:hypothetical protein
MRLHPIMRDMPQHLTKPRSRRAAAFVFAVFFLVTVCFASKQFVMPKTQPANSYPAHDEHANEHVSVAVDPYDTADKASIFATHYNEEELMPVLMTITNDGDQPISLNNMKAELITVNRTKLAPSSSDDIYRRLAHPSASASRSPLPFPKKKVKGSVSSETLDEIQRASFGARAVEPHSTQSGFLFFDVSGISTPLAGAHFYLTGVKDGGGNELLYFEIPLEKYLSAPPAKTP